MKKIISVILAISVVLCSFAFCASATEGKQYRDYKVYTLLGDSVASGYDDVEKDSTSCQFKYKENGYGAKVAKVLGAKLNSMACPAVRTVEMRYLLEDDYPADDYMFYGIGYDWQRESFKQEYRDAVSEADLITVGIGGNDYLTYLVWVVMEKMEETGLGVHKEFVNTVKELIKEEGIDESTFETILDVASVIDVLPDLAQMLPEAFVEALKRYYENWDRVIEDICYYNEDAELYVVGGLNYSYCEIFDKIDDSTGILNAVGSAVAELGNKPQEDGADKYGYTFISTDGTDCVLTHPTPDGYTRSANLILDALPDMRYAYSDAAYGTEYYKAVYFMTRNGYMSSVSDTEFGVNEKLTVGALAEALSNMAGQTEADSFAWATEKGFVKTDADSDVGYFELISALNSFSKDQGKADFFYTIRFFIYTVKNMLSGVLFGSLSRGDAAKLICGYCDL